MVGPESSPRLLLEFVRIPVYILPSISEHLRSEVAAFVLVTHVAKRRVLILLLYDEPNSYLPHA